MRAGRASQGREWRLGRWVLGGALALSWGQVGCDRKTPSEGAIRADALGPVPAPPGLIGELTIAHPNATWVRMRETMGGSFKFLPASYGMMVTTALGLPPQVAEQIDADVPTLGAAVSDGTREVPVVAVHVRDGRQVVQLMTGGAEARYTSKVDAPSGVTLLEPKPGQTALAASVGVTGNYLLVGYAPDGLLRVGPYAARTMSTRPVPSEDVVLVSDHDALAGPLRTRLSMWWGEMRRGLEQSDREQRQKHGGSAPTFGDPSAALQKADTTFQGVFALMTDLREGRVTLALDEAGAHLRATLTPQSPDGVAARELATLKTGSVAPMLDLPSSTSVALMTHDSAELRERSAADQGEAIEKLLAGKIEENDRKRLQDALSSWSKGRGDWLLLGGKITPDDRTLFARSAVADAERLERGLRSTVELVRVPALAEPVQHWLGELKFAAPVPLDGAKGSLVKIERKLPAVQLDPAAADRKGAEKKKGEGAGDKGKGKAPERDALELAWVLDPGAATYVLGRDARGALAELSATAAPTLRAEEDVKAMVESLGSEATFALLVLPVRLMGGLSGRVPPGARVPASPLVLASGRGAQGGWLRAEVSPGAMRELMKMRPQD